MNKNNRFLTELRARGLQITPQEARTLMNIAIAEHDKAVVMPVLKREKIAHYAILALSTNLCMEWMIQSSAENLNSPFAD